MQTLNRFRKNGLIRRILEVTVGVVGKRTGLGRRTRSVGLVGSLVAALICVMAFAGVAQALRVKAHNWPNNPARHTPKQRVGAATPSFSANLRGGVAIAGNTVETCPANLAATRKRLKHHPKGRGGATEPCIGDNNNDQDMKYVNVDPAGDAHFNSSTAKLTVPAGATAVKAFLYWAGDLSRGIDNGQGRTGHAAPGGDTPEGQTPHVGDKPHEINTAYGTVDLRVGSGAGYSPVNAFAQGSDVARWDSVSSWYSSSPQTKPPEGGSPGWAYQVRADVTSQLNNALATRPPGNESFPITVANVQAGTGLNRYAGWNLVVVWRLTTAPFRDITLFDGFDFVQVQGDQQLVVGPLDFTGFQTPHSGNVDAHVTVWATEGDRAIKDDYLALGGLTSKCGDLTKQSDKPVRPVDNFFNSSISNAGKSVTDRTPAYDNQLGFDLGTLALPEGTIHNDATGASVCLGTSGDTYFFGGLVFDTLIKAPNLKISKSVNQSHANPGDTVTYTTTVTNPQRSTDDPLYPTDAATNVVVADPLPSGLDFVAITNNPDGVCSYDAADRIVECKVGRLDPDEEFTFSYEATVSAVAAGDSPAPLVNYACFTANSEDQPSVPFTGCDQASVIVPPAPPPPADLGVVKTVSHNTVKPGDELTWTVVGTNYGPVTSTNFVLADQLPPGVAFVSATASAALSCTTPPVGTSGAIRCTAPSVPAAPADGSSLTLTIVATVPSTTANNTLLLNIATVSGDQTEPTPDPHPNRDQTLTLVLVPDTPIPPVPPNPPIPPNPPLPPDPSGPPQLPVPPVHPPRLPSGPAGTRIALHKTSFPKVVRSGHTISYTLRVSNVGEAAALHVRVCDSPPSGVTVTSAPRFHRSGKSICTTISRLNVAAHKVFHLRARANSSTRGKVTNHATATARNAKSVRSRAPTLVVGPPPQPLVTG